MNLQNPNNVGLLAYLSRTASADPLFVKAEDFALDPYLQAGSHPDVVERVWDELGEALPLESRCLVFGTPALVHGGTGTILAVALGTTYALRVPSDHFPDALSFGAEQVHHYSSTATTLDVSDEFGADWVFGKWHEGETSWCQAAHRTAL